MTDVFKKSLPLPADFFLGDYGDYCLMNRVTCTWFPSMMVRR